MTASLTLLGQHRSFDGWVKRYQHDSSSTQSPMRFSIYLPPVADKNKVVPVLYWLSGLTCTEDNFMQKAGAQQMAAKLGVAIVAPDTSPRGEGVPDDQNYDLGQGAGFYVNATQMPWSQHYFMYDYVVDELPNLIEQHFPVTDRRSISGHSMGGHGALVIALRNPNRYLSVSAFSPICQPSQVPWGEKAFSNYLGRDHVLWQNYDACSLLVKCHVQLPMRIEQGLSDEWLSEQLNLDVFEAAAKQCGYPVEIMRRANYDHSYYFISSFIESDLCFHAKHLNANAS